VPSILAWAGAVRWMERREAAEERAS